MTPCQAVGVLARDLIPMQAAVVLHLLTCSECQESVLNELMPVVERWVANQTAEGPWLEAGTPTPQEIASGILEKREELVRTQELLSEILGMPAAERRRALTDERFHSVRLLEYLLEGTSMVMRRDAGEAEAMASLCGDLGWRLSQKKSAELDSLRLKAAVLLGNARRLQGRLLESEEAFGQAASFAELSGWLERGEYLQGLAILRWQEGRVEEAKAFLRASIRAFMVPSYPSEAADSCVLLGLIFLERQSWQEAARFLEDGLLDFDAAVRPWLTARVYLSLALAKAELGDKIEARRLLSRATGHPFYGDPGQAVRLLWLEARVRRLLGEVSEAEHILSGVGRRLVAEKDPEALIWALDAARHFSQEGRPEKARMAMAEVNRRFEGEEGFAEALRSARAHAVHLMKNKESAASCVSRGFRMVRQQLRFCGKSVDPLPFV